MTSPQDPYQSPTGAPAGAPPYPTGDGRPTGTYGAPGPAYGVPGGVEPPRARRNGLGIAALVLGVLALISCWTVVGGILFGLAAVVLGVLGRGRARRGEATNGGLALAGVVLGVVGIVLSAGLLALGVSVYNSDEGKQLRDCVAQADGDQQAADRCAQQFADNS